MRQCGYDDAVHLRDARYDHVVHMMTAAKGAEDFYQLDNNPARSEGLELARDLDARAANVSLTLKGFPHRNEATSPGCWIRGGPLSSTNPP